MPLQKVVQLIVPYNIVCILVVHARRVKTERVVERGTLCAGTKGSPPLTRFSNNTVF